MDTPQKKSIDIQNHRYVDQWEPSVAYKWGSSIDPIVEDYMRNMMSQSTYPHLARRMYEGVLQQEIREQQTYKCL